MGRKRVTMSDVAEEAKVSIQTVSCVVNNKPGITDETRARVEQAVDKLGYRPYRVAQSLRTQETRTIALVVSDISNPSLGIMASAAENYAHKLGYSLVLYNTHDSQARETKYLQTAIDRWVDGIIFVSARGPVHNWPKSLPPTVAIDRIPESYHGPSVTLDNIRAGKMAAQHLLDLGHVNFAHIAGPLDLQLARERLQGFQEAIEAAGVSPGLSVVESGTWACRSGYEIMQDILDRPAIPTAVFTANDRMAIGALSAIRESGLRIPEDISVMGLDDIEIARFQSPPLTTIKNPFEELATRGARLLLDVLMDKEPAQRHVLLKPVLVHRNSTGHHR